MQLAIMEKECLRCGDTKTVYNFPRSKSSPDGYCAYCKDCRNIMRMENIRKNRYVSKKRILPGTIQRRPQPYSEEEEELLNIMYRN